MSHSFPTRRSSDLSKSITFSSKPKNVQVVGSQIRSVWPLVDMQLLFTYTSASLDSSQVYVKVNGASLTPSADFTIKAFTDTKRLLLDMRPLDMAHIDLEVGYQPGTYLSESISLQRSNPGDLISIRTPTVQNPSQNFTFWTTAGSEYQFQVFAFGSIDGQLIYSSSLAVSEYGATLSNFSSAGSSAYVTVIFRFVTGSTELFFNRRIYLITQLNRLALPNTIIGTTYRDGSTLHSSGVEISIGTFIYKSIFGLDNTQANVTVNLVQNNAESIVQKNPTLDYSKGNKITMSSSIASGLIGTPISAAFEYLYYQNSGTIVSQPLNGGIVNYACSLKLYNPQAIVMTATHITSASTSDAIFDIQTTGSSAIDTYNHHDESQYQYTIALHYANAILTPVYLTAVDRYHRLTIDGVLYTMVNSSLPTIDVIAYDFNEFSRSTTVSSHRFEGY